MSVTRYIDIDSSFRDRLSYPDVGSFTVPVNSTQFTSTAFNSVDPVILSFPYDVGALTAIALNAFGGIDITLGAGSSNIANFYVGSFIQINNYYSMILIYNSTTKVASTITPYPGPLPPIGTYYTIRFELPTQLNGGVYSDTTLVNAPSTKQVILGAAASSTDNYYVGQYLFLLPSVPIFPWFKDNILYAYQWSIITSYNGTTKTATLLTPFITTPLLGTRYEILRFSYDNFNPARYLGTDIFSNPMCADISLTCLTIPAYLPLNTINAGYITDYPYIYVSLYSEKGITYNQPLISNNPNSNKVLFKCIIPTTQQTEFLQLGSVIGSVRVAFRENDTLRVEILLPNGQPIKFNTGLGVLLTGGSFTYFDGLSFPCPPNPKTQIQITFSITKSSS